MTQETASESQFPNSAATTQPLPLRVICLHGHPGSGAAFGDLVAFLKEQGITAIAPDLRGYGNFQVKNPFQMQDHVNDLWERLQKEPQYRYVLVGWSLGGIIAMELAWRYLATPQDLRPKLVGLALVGTAAHPVRNLPPMTWSDYGNTLLAILCHWLLPYGTRWHIDRIGKRSLLRYLIHRHDPAVYQKLATLGAKAVIQTSRHATNALSQAISAGYNRNQDLKQIDLPCLVITGIHDRHISSKASQETAALLPNHELHCYDDAAHLLPWEQPERFHRDLYDWLNSQILPVKQD
ncbi:MAG: alpha/beta fold hydrolase [Pseudanabaenaceae cyanobacterium]